MPIDLELEELFARAVRLEPALLRETDIEGVSLGEDGTLELDQKGGGAGRRKLSISLFTLKAYSKRCKSFIERQKKRIRRFLNLKLFLEVLSVVAASSVVGTAIWGASSWVVVSAVLTLLGKALQLICDAMIGLGVGVGNSIETLGKRVEILSEFIWKSEELIYAISSELKFGEFDDEKVCEFERRTTDLIAAVMPAAVKESVF